MHWIFTECFLGAKPVLGAGAKKWTKQTKAFLHSISSQCMHSSGQEEANDKQFSSVAQLCPTLCDPMNCSTPGLSVHHQLPESTQAHVHHPLSSPSPPTLNLSQHQGLFQWVSSLYQVARVLEWDAIAFSGHYLLKLTQIHVHWVGDTIYHLILSHPPFAFNLS